MENKLNIVELQIYAKSVARELSRSYFTPDKRFVSGAEIIRFSTIEQVNYFAIKILFVKWKEEMATLKKNTYFNYDNPEVETAFEDLMNVLSNNISIKPFDFELLLAQAVEETIYLSLSPYHYFKIYYFSPELTKITLKELKEKAKYLKLNATFFIHFIEKLETYRIPSFLVSDIIGYFQESYYSTNDTFDAYEPIVDSFNKIVPISLEKIVTDLKRKEDVSLTPLEVFENKKKSMDNAVVEVRSNVTNNIKPIKLSLNHRIMFLKELFENDMQKMDYTMARLEAAGTIESALSILSFQNWDKEKDATIEFRELIEAKYKS